MKLPSPNPSSFCAQSHQGFQPRFRKARRLERRGFTLVELMVAILILVVLVAILLPVVDKMMKQGRKSKSIGNLRSMGSALVLYVGDNNGAFPPGAHRSSTVLWFNELDRYITQTDTGWPKIPERPMWQRCPAKVFNEWGLSAGRAVSVGYGWNHSYFGYTSEAQYKSLGWMSRMSEVERPSETIIIGTSRDDVNPANDLGHVLIYPAGNNVAKRFDGGGLYLFLDGHVQWLRPAELSANDNHLFRKIKKP